MPPGQTPHTVVLYAHHDLVDAVQPGDRYIMSLPLPGMLLTNNKHTRNFMVYDYARITLLKLKNQPHTRVAVTGIYRATPLRVTRRQRAVKAVYRTYVDVIHFRKTDTRRLRGREGEEEEGNG